MGSDACATSEAVADSDDDHYEDFLAATRDQFRDATASDARLFTTTASGLFDNFLAALPAGRRQHYNCRACRRFVDRFGGLVAIAADGAAVPVMWNESMVPAFFRAPVRAMARAVGRAVVSGVFLSDEKTWGMPSNTSAKPPYMWRHMSVEPDRVLIHKPSVVQTTSQAIAEKLQDYCALQRSLAEFPIEVVGQAHALLTSGNLYRSETCIGVAKWLLDLHESRGATKNIVVRDNLTWLAVATAPAGFCHVRSGMIGTLLEDIAAGLAFADIKAKFDAKMHPLQYRRPQAAPSAGNIAQAEKIVQALASAGALSRRFARLDDIQALWRPATSRSEPQQGGIFSHLKPQSASPVPQIEQPATLMTWDKFRRTVLPDADAIEFYVPAQRAPYAAMVTAANPDAPPIIQWDRVERRNPVTWYLYNGGSLPQAWNLRAGTFHRVTAVSLQPSMWDPDAKFAHHGEGVFFILDGAWDVAYSAGAGYFPELLRSEYHGVRATMEAYARTAIVAGADEASACGIKLQKGAGAWNYLFRVTSKGGRMTYKLDRWD